MIVSKAARRYAGALLDLAVSQGSVAGVHADMVMIGTAIGQSRELLLFLRSPIIRRDRKSAALVALFGSRVSALTLEFLKLLTLKGRENQIPGICVAFLEQYNLQMGMAKAVVRSAVPLSDDSLKMLAKALSKKLGKQISLTVQIDASLIGGIQVQAGDLIIDGTVRNSLNRLAEAFNNHVV